MSAGRIKILGRIEQETPPKGKRSIRKTVYGNTNGYIAGRFWACLGATHDPATIDAEAEFLAGEQLK